MAQVSSGSFITTNYEGRYVQFNWAVDSTSVSGNYKRIYWSLVGGGDAEWTTYMAGNFKVVIDGETVYSSADRIELKKGTVVASGYKTLYHDATGNKSFSASAEAGIYYYAVNCRGSGSWELPTIPRYANVSHSLADKTETTITINWGADASCDHLQYSIDGGKSFVDVNGYPNYTITGLTQNTTYNIVTKVKRRDSQLWSQTGALVVTTYNYPHCISSPDFIIGDTLTLEFYNPLSRSILVKGYSKTDGREIFGGATSGTRIDGFNDGDSVNEQYASIPNSQSGEYTVVAIYNDIPMKRDAGSVYRVRGNEIPTINAFDYVDKNQSVVDITKNSTQIVQNKSVLLARFHPATANYGAGGISRYYIEVNGYVRNEILSGAYEMGTIDSGNDVDLTLTAVDSRGLSASKTIKVSMLAYSEPNALVTLKRLNNYEDETYLTVDGSVSSVNNNNTMAIKYRYKVSGGSYNSFIAIGDNEKHTLSLDKNNEYIFNIVITDAFGSKYDKEHTLSKGIFPLFIDTVKNSVGINCFPKQNYSLEVNGLNVFDVADKVNKSINDIYIGPGGGLTISVEKVSVGDKIPIIITGSDNSSVTPVYTIINYRTDGLIGHINLGLEITVTRNGKYIHINASQYSYYSVLVPLGCEITLSNSLM